MLPQLARTQLQVLRARMGTLVATALKESPCRDQVKTKIQRLLSAGKPNSSRYYLG